MLIFVSSLLTLAVKIHNCTKFAVKKNNFSPLILHVFPIFVSNRADIANV